MEQSPQFGIPASGVSYRGRPAAFGILENSGKIAVVQVTLRDGTPPYHDLPGGALDPGEVESVAVVREFAEETGLLAETGPALGRAGQYFTKSDGEPVNNRCAFFAMRLLPGQAKKVEDDHELVWIDPQEALKRLRHDAHAWAVCLWLRKTLDTDL